LRVVVVDKIATLLQRPLYQHIQEIPHLTGLIIAHPVTIHEKFDTSLLIGADHFRDKVEDEAIREGGPTAVAFQTWVPPIRTLQTSSVSTSNTDVKLLQTLSSTQKEEINLQHK